MVKTSGGATRTVFLYDARSGTPRVKRVDGHECTRGGAAGYGVKLRRDDTPVTPPVLGGPAGGAWASRRTQAARRKFPHAAKLT